MRAERLRVLVSGRIATVPDQGGATWAVLQYLLGLRELGHDVWFVESIPADPAGADLACSTNAAYARPILSGLGFSGRWALVAEGTTRTAGCDYRTLAATHWDVHVNLSGCLGDPELTGRIPVRIYVDLDPAFTQIWHDADGQDVGLGGHTHFATVGCGIGTPACPVPTVGRNWHHTLPPVVLSHWTVGAEVTRPAMTTVANWRSYGSVVWDGEAYGQRAHSFRAFFDLPNRTDVALALALAIDPGETADLAALAGGGWALIDPALVSASPEAYRDFVRSSRGELSIAKSGYVASRSGWFSDRSACYLASGRPVVAQDTGFGWRLPVGEGLLAFSTVAEAVEALERVDADYARHAIAARRIAVEELDSAVVLADLLDHAGIGPGLVSRRRPVRRDHVGAVIEAAWPGATVTRRRSPYTTTHRLEEVEATGSDGQTVRLVAKHLGPQSLTEAGRRSRRAAPGNGGELAVYRDVLAGAGLGTPTLIGGWSGSPSGGGLVLERVQGTPLTEVGDFGVWLSGARWLARMHARFAATVPTGLACYALDRLDASGRRGLERAASQCWGSEEVRAALAAGHERALTAMAAAVPTLVHGDFYPSNILVAGDRIAVVDWELAGTGPGVLDLAAFLAGGWSSQQRLELTQAYHEESATTEPLAALVADTDLASLHIALRWVGSEPGWTAPADHHRDWFADAVAALGRLAACRP